MAKVENINEEVNEMMEEHQVMEQEEKEMKPKKKILTKKNMIKAAKYSAAFVLGVFAKVGFDMLVGGVSSAATGNTVTEVPVPDVKVDNVVNF